MARDKIKPAGDPKKALLSAIAMDIGKEVVAHLEVMYPDVYAAMNSGCKLSIRNLIHNEITGAIKWGDQNQIVAHIAKRKGRRRDWLKAYREMRRQDARKKLPEK